MPEIKLTLGLIGAFQGHFGTLRPLKAPGGISQYFHVFSHSFLKSLEFFQGHCRTFKVQGVPHNISNCVISHSRWKLSKICQGHCGPLRPFVGCCGPLGTVFGLKGPLKVTGVTCDALKLCFAFIKGH